jgi:arylamine N-acetyltransferase
VRVDLAEESLVVDVGFGTALTAPLALEAGTEQNTQHESFRLVPVEDEFDLQVKFGDVWTDLYRLSLQEQMPIDYEAINWYTSTTPTPMSSLPDPASIADTLFSTTSSPLVTSTEKSRGGS